MLLRLIVRAIHVVIHLAEEPRTGRRLVTHVFEVTGLEGGTIQGHDLWPRDPVTGRLAWTGMPPVCLKRFEELGIPYALPGTPARELVGA